MGILGAAASAQSVVINEFVLNHVGTDTNEFIELFGNPNESFSTLTILQVEGEGTGIGLVDTIDAGGTANATGFWTTAFFGNRWENGTLSLLLVSGFTGAVGNDLDTDNNGTFDITPWTSIVDSIAINDGTAGDITYGTTTLNNSFDGGTLSVGGASRIPNGVDTDATTDWMRNDFDGFGIPGFTGTPAVGEAVNTPNDFNQAAVPEPATMGALAIGALALLRRRKR
jgi:hypothetical protein